MSDIMEVMRQTETDLFKETAFLNDVWNGFHLDALSLIDIFQGIEFARLFVLNDPDL